MTYGMIVNKKQLKVLDKNNVEYIYIWTHFL